MNPTIRHIIPLAGLVLALPALQAADAPEAKKEVRKEIRVLAAPAAPAMPGGPMERRVQWVQALPAEMETVTFLGVQTAPVGPTLAAQLGLAKDHGLAVAEVVPDSPAAGALQTHDILLKFNDQILVDVRQLTVLVRGAKEGDDVVLTYLRAGKQATATVKLARKEMPKRLAFEGAVGEPGFNWQGLAAPVAPVPRGDADRLLGMIELGRDGARRVVRHNEVGGDRLVTITVNTGDNQMSYSDEKGSLEVNTKDGVKALVAKDANGEVLFDGPINTPEERKALPPAVAERLAKIEGMRGFSFKTDEAFEGGEIKIVRPQGRGISLPVEPAKPATSRLREL
jgi:serine protease Do